MLEEFLFVEKYRPHTIEECILPAELKNTFAEFVKQGDIPNLILSGGPGVGKTTVAKAMLEELGCTYIIINGSMNGNIDTLRTEINNFASTMSFDGKRKYVILDEADYLNATSTQPALRSFMEEFSANCGFIMTCNFINRIIAPLQSRCSVVPFVISPKEKPKMAMRFFKRLKTILATENIEADPAVVQALVIKHFPDWRRVLNEIQRYSVDGKIDSGILASVRGVDVTDLITTLREKNFTEMRRWVGENLASDPSTMFRTLFDGMNEYMTPQSVPQFVLHLGKYQYQSAFVVDQEINFVSFLTEVMADIDWS
jgi:DNA polymerase III delta prime subunit